jgi:hypothetical protein
VYRDYNFTDEDARKKKLGKILKITFLVAQKSQNIVKGKKESQRMEF